MHHRQLIGFAIVFVLQNAVMSLSAWAGETPPQEPACESNLTPANEVKKVPNWQIGVKVLTELNVPGDNWLSWKAGPDGRTWLGVLSGRSSLNVFEPSDRQDPIFSRDLKDGSKFSGAAWSKSGGLVAGDDRGNLWRYDIFASLESGPEYQGSAVSVFPATIDDALALGLGDLSRVRIMPVGSVGHGRDLVALGTVLDVQTHRSFQGRNLAAVVSSGSIQVFDLDSPSDSPIFTRTVSGAAKVQWIVDDSGESALVYLNGGVLAVTFPLSDRPAVIRDVPLNSDFTTLRSVGGEVLFLLSGAADHRAEVLAFRQNLFFLRAVIENAVPGQTLIENPSGAVFVAYMGKAQRAMHIARLSDVNAPVFTLTFDGDEVVRRFSAIKVSADRTLLAVGTTSKIYILELTQ